MCADLRRLVDSQALIVYVEQTASIGVTVLADAVLRRVEIMLNGGMYWRDLRQRMLIKMKTDEAERALQVGSE